MSNKTPHQAPAVEEVILIHGTFAGHENDEGDSWWQKGSKTWLRLEQMLPSNAAIGSVFHWGKGPNTFRARREAGEKLLDRLIELEKKNISYHLIGHSHGGSVIWECLLLAYHQHLTLPPSDPDRHYYELDKLKNWITIGTPFIKWASDSVLTKGMFHNDQNLAEWPKSKLFLWFYKPHSKYVGVIVALLVNLLIFGILLGVLGIIPLTVWALIVDSNSGQPNNYWAIPIIALVILGYLGMTLIIGNYSFRLINSLTTLRDRILSSEVSLRYLPRWCGVVSCQDEALGALKSAVQMELPIMSERKPTFSILTSDKMLPVARWFRDRIVDPLYNFVVPKYGNKFINTQLSRNILGADFQGGRASAVSNNPLSSEDIDIFLPKEIDNKIVELANDRAAALVPALRSAIYSMSESGFQSSGETNPDLSKGLVHTSYFEIDEVLEILSSAICLSSENPKGSSRQDIPHYNWINSIRTKVCSDLPVSNKTELS